MSSEATEIQLNIDEARKMVENARALERLQSNPDFKRIFEEGYFREEAIRLVHLKSDAHMQSPEKQASILRDVDAIGSLIQYLNNIFHTGNMAQDAIAEGEQALDKLHSEGAED